eukprot:TRINITY_DN82137_c0_g1_i1.p1 TRINITY_DN82137_c0_g1~~TRINITY_DN82137_c0_g1_i1.p1  ORF type:complete len:520 (-),score=126.67 TRINITY_DN82137_c0_g1_i1:315-1874(-)
MTHMRAQVTIDPSEYGKLQESDLMERLPNGEDNDEETSRIQLVSLGSYCAPKMSFKKIGHGAATLPFDWMRTTMKGLLHFLRNDFEGFFDFISKVPVPPSTMVAYRHTDHSFWHDDPTDPNMRERYTRRFERFKAIDASKEPVLFVRSVAYTGELAQAEELLAELKSRFGECACLALLVDRQETVQGPITVEGASDLLLYFIPRRMADDPAPYSEPVVRALDWVVGRKVEARRFVDIATVLKFADDAYWGYQAMHGVAVFDDGSQPVAVMPAVTPAQATPVAAIPNLTAEMIAGVTMASLGGTEELAQALSYATSGGAVADLPHAWLQGAEVDTESYEMCFEFLQTLVSQQQALLAVRACRSLEDVHCIERLRETVAKACGPLGCVLIVVDAELHNARPGAYMLSKYEDLVLYLQDKPEAFATAGSEPPTHCLPNGLTAALRWIRGEAMEAAEYADMDEFRAATGMTNDRTKASVSTSNKGSPEGCPNGNRSEKAEKESRISSCYTGLLAWLFGSKASS